MAFLFLGLLAGAGLGALQLQRGIAAAKATVHQYAAQAREELAGLPDVPGEEVARELRATSDVPIVMLTARTDERDRIALKVLAENLPGVRADGLTEEAVLRLLTRAGRGE